MSHPLVPLHMFMLRNVATANAASVLWAAALFAWVLISALYVQRVLNYSAMQVRLAFLQANTIVAVFSLGLSARLVMRSGIRAPLSLGLLLAALGLMLFARGPVGGNLLPDVLPGMVLLGLGTGMAFNPMLLAGMSDVAPDESGVVNTSFMMGGALGLAILASLAAVRAGDLASAETDAVTALIGGFHLAFLLGAIAAALASALTVAFVRTRSHGQAQSEASAASI